MKSKKFSHAGIIRFKGQFMTYVPGVIGSLQAIEAVKYILGVGDLLTGYLLTYDALKMEFRKVKFPKHVLFIIE